jgi:esterase/lipase
MKKQIIFLALFLLISNSLFGQFDPKLEEYRHYSIIVKNDTINYHIYSKNKINPETGIILFIQGSGSNPLFVIKKNAKSETINSEVPINLEKIPIDFAFIIISKKCTPFSITNKKYIAPKCFFENEGLDYRVWQNGTVLNEVISKQIKNPKKVIVIGASEGSDVVAKLGTVNKKITHIGFWAGGDNTQFYDFAIFIRKDVTSGKINEATAKIRTDSLFQQIKDIEADPNSITKFWEGNTYRRWSKFSEPAINNLLKINIPVFVALGAKDKSVPIESGLLIPVEFSRYKKTNLIFKLYPDYDHSFNTVPLNENNPIEYHLNDVFDEFMKWTETNNPR